MKKIKMDIEKEYVYHEKLDNGLNIYLYSKDDINNNYVTFTTKFGSIYNEFVPIDSDKMIKVPNGIAHFLEHKIFEQKNGLQPEEFYARSGANTNAYTTFKNTTYLFSGPNNVYENTLYLLDFVQELYLTEENVEKEKGIIIQEINMCNDRPGDLLHDKLRENSLNSSKFKESIIGTKEEVNSITIDMLEMCYNTFYHPSNMFLVVTGNFDVKKMIELIKENQSKKEFLPYKKVKVNFGKEKDNIVKDKEIVHTNTNIPKIAYSLKIPLKDIKLDKRRINLYTYILFTLLFDDTSLFDEELKKEKIITNSISLSTINLDSHMLVSLINQTFKCKEYIEKIDKYLENIKIEEKDLARKKKLLISNEIFYYDSIYSINDSIVSDIIFDNRIENNSIELINSLNIDEFNEFINNIEYEKSIVIVKNKDKEEYIEEENNDE